MPRPKSKPELEKAAQDNFESLMELVNSIDEKDLEKNGVNGEWSVKDILAHLHAWHLMMISWYKEGQKGDKPAIPAEGYTWKDTPALNEKIYNEHKATKLEEVISKFKKSHRDNMKIIKSHSDKELFTKRLLPWTGTTSLGAYLISATSSHYDWAEKLIKKWLKSKI